MMQEAPAKSILIPVASKNRSWFQMDYTMNLYRGCCHGCVYCDSRSDCYHIDSFDTVRVKENCLSILEEELRHKLKKGVVGTGAMSDPYNPFEADYLYTKSALELLDRYHFGVGVATKSALVTRDIALFLRIRAHSPVLMKMTVTSADDSLCRKIEPGVSVSSERFRAIREMSAAGVFCGILLMPVLPFLEDSRENILAVVEMAHQSGARFIYPAFGMTLRQGNREWYFKKLDALFPEEGLREKYLKMYGGRYQCISPKARALWEVFSSECQKRGILYRMQDIIRAYRQGYHIKQLSLFD